MKNFNLKNVFENLNKLLFCITRLSVKFVKMLFKR